MVIYESDRETATNTDILAGGRLNSIPFDGNLTIRLQSDLGDTTNNYRFTIQLPDGDVPVDNQFVTADNPALGGVLDDRTALTFTFRVRQGGHVIFSCTETGAAIMTWQAVLRP